MISWNDKASPHGYPTAQRAAAVVPPTSRPTLLHVLAFRLVDGARRWRVTL